MREEEFRAWMVANGQSPATVSTRTSDARRVEAHYGDLDEAYDRDRFAAILSTLSYSAADKAAGRPNPSRFEINGDLNESLSNFRSLLSAYSDFRSGVIRTPESQADRIRQFLLTNYVDPARHQNADELTIRAGDVHRAMGLANAMPAVCNVLDGAKFRTAAGLVQVKREGPPQGANVEVRYRFAAQGAFDIKAAEAILAQRYGPATAESQKMIAFNLADGRAIALQRDISKVQLWLEDSGAAKPPPADAFQHYTPMQGRHSNLPSRLRHNPDQEHQALGFPKSVFSVRAATRQEFERILDWYDGTPQGLNREQLERMKREFLARYPDFEPQGFAGTSGGYFEEERAYKDRLLERAQAALAQAGELDDAELGGQLLDLLISRESGLLGWRTDGRIKNLRAAHPGVLENAAGALARDLEDPPHAVERFVQQCWATLAADQDKNQPYSESRNIPTMIAAFVRPHDAYGINTEPVQRTYKALIGSQVFAYQPLTADEYQNVLSMVRQIHDIMRDEWRWSPRDLWDVQGFIWAVSRSDKPQLDEVASAAEGGASRVPPTNLILYGPPGTGKTYATTHEAVMLCDGTAPDDRAELKQRYDSLVEAGQIAFVTFHQSYAYEDFVEGLRPTTGETDDADSASTGFRLEPRRGVFREIALLADQARKTANQPGGFDLAGRQFIKMSLGRAGVEDHIYDAAIEGNYVVLGWGGEVDWSDPQYDEYDAIFKKWNEIEPGTSGNSGNIAQVWRFRAGLKPGDLVIVSEGNSHFRAIGEIVGPYRYEPTGERTYNHKREVRWLLVLDDPLPVDTIYDGKFTQMSCYGLKPAKVKREALSRLLPGPAPMANNAPDQFVLIIDEINRANISKVFGELITLIEPDKRVGEANALRLKLPYSGDTFGVPNNLHIIGTMNTADRSIALLDTALRRRFDFRELMPEPALLAEDVDGIPLRNLLKMINERIEYLFDREHQIGHAYFIGCRSKGDVDRTMRDKIIPLLQEYFYEDWSKVALVLGDADGAGHFIERKALTVPSGGGAESGFDERFRWSVKSTFDPAAYAQFK